MPLLIDGRQVQLQDNLTNFARAHVQLHSSSRQFKTKPSINVNSSQSLYVNQLEYAVVSTEDSIDLITVSKFTTCCCLILRHNGSGATGVGHFDENDIDNSVKNIANTVIRLTHEWTQKHNIPLASLGTQFVYEVHLVGGFLDARGISEEVCWQLLESLQSLPIDLHLKTACIWNYNTYYQDNISLPSITSLVCNVKSGKVSPANVSCFGPLAELRSLRFSMRPPVIMQSIYDTFQRILEIESFESTLSDDTIKQLLGLNTNSFLHFLSTSPMAESVDYVPSLKIALRYLLDNRTTMFQTGKLFKFMRVNSQWEQLGVTNRYLPNS